ncbi:uncharacterized protein LOC129226814 [Uloborus diversus]|uniref:uncharacterized protein LOC129226814 n=1 Tax=Uloborus diversus TaxID=327109 RepID=UPI0024092CB1|nr:uncharacterized protein LOC129226814 [Uloborus diversus]
MNLLHGERPAPRPHPARPPYPPASHQRSPFAIQELLGLGSNNDDAGGAPPPPSPAVSSAAAVSHQAQPPYQPPPPQPQPPPPAQCFPDPGRMYFGAAFMHGMTAPPMPPMMGFDNGHQAHHFRTDANGECP